MEVLNIIISVAGIIILSMVLYLFILMHNEGPTLYRDARDGHIFFEENKWGCGMFLLISFFVMLILSLLSNIIS